MTDPRANVTLASLNAVVMWNYTKAFIYHKLGDYTNFRRHYTNATELEIYILSRLYPGERK